MIEYYYELGLRVEKIAMARVAYLNGEQPTFTHALVRHFVVIKHDENTIYESPPNNKSQQM